MKKYIFIFICGFFVMSSEKLFAAGCLGNPRFKRSSIIHFTSTPVKTVYSHDLATSQIEALWQSRYKTPRMREPGLTMAEAGYELKTRYRYERSRHGNQEKYCVWAESVDIDFSFKRMDVYISSQYPAGSCEYNVILKHENQHVAINKRTSLLSG